MRLCAQADVDPSTSDLLLWEVGEIARTKSSRAWDHTASILFVLHRANARKGSRKITFDQLHPFAKDERRRARQRSVDDSGFSGEGLDALRLACANQKGKR